MLHGTARNTHPATAAGVRVHHFGGRGFRRQSTQEEGGERSSFAQILQIVPLLILFALTMFSFGDSREAMFSLDETREYRVKRHTSHPAVIEGLPYYVKPTFGQRAGRDLYKVRSSPSLAGTQHSTAHAVAGFSAGGVVSGAVHVHEAASRVYTGEAKATAVPFTRETEFWPTLAVVLGAGATPGMRCHHIWPGAGS